MRFLLYFSCVFIIANSSSLISQNEVVSSGADVKSQAGSVSYSVGQVNYIAIEENGNIINEGMQQPYEIYNVSSVSDERNIDYITVYPNPAYDKLTIELKGSQSGSLSCQLFDLKSNLLRSIDLNFQQTDLMLNELAAGTFIVEIKQDEKIIQTYKIIKN